MKLNVQKSLEGAWGLIFMQSGRWDIGSIHSLYYGIKLSIKSRSCPFHLTETNILKNFVNTLLSGGRERGKTSVKNEMPDLCTKMCNPNLYYQSGVRIPRGEIKITLQDHFSPTFLAEAIVKLLLQGNFHNPGSWDSHKKNSITEDETTIRIINQPPKKMNHSQQMKQNQHLQNWKEYMNLKGTMVCFEVLKR